MMDIQGLLGFVEASIRGDVVGRPWKVVEKYNEKSQKLGKKLAK